MVSSPSISFIPKEKLVEIANDFLNKYNQANRIPVPIEEIVELSLGIRMIPIPTLKKLLGFDSYISSDFKSIMIDSYTFDNHEDITRFTYAHEVSHFLLHKELYESQKFSDVQDYLKFQNSLPNETIKRIESQAYRLAGYLLLPNAKFREMVDKFIANLGGMRLITILNVQQLVEMISQKFNVSVQCAYKQLEIEYDDLKKILINSL